MEPGPEQLSASTPDITGGDVAAAVPKSPTLTENRPAAPSTESPSFLIPPAEALSRPAPSAYHGPGAAGAGSTKPDITKPNALDTPFNGALQPTENAVVNQGSLLEDVSASIPDAPITEPPKPVPRARIIGVSLMTFGLLAALFLGVRVELNKSHAQVARLSPSDQLKAQQLPTASLSKQLGTVQTASAVTVNGQLQVTSSLVLQPSTLTGPAVTGQMYYDAATNTLAYYNGKQYVSLQGGGNTYITNVAGSTTNITNITNVTNASGGGFTGTGTPGTLAMFNSATTLGDSLITQSGTTLNVGNGAGVNTTNVQGGTGGISIMTGATSGASGEVTIKSGDSTTTSSGNVSIDTGLNAVTGTVVLNHTFEAGTEGIGDGYGFLDTYASSTAQAHGGTHSLAVTSGNGQYGGGSNPSWGAYDSSPFTTPVVPGDNYLFSAWIRANTNARSVECDVYWSSTGYGGGGLVEQDQWCSVTDSTSTWKHVSGTLTAPQGAYSLGLGFIGYSTPAGEIHYIDDVTATNISSSPTVSVLNLGADNAQQVNIGNSGQTAATTIYGHGMTLNGGQSAVSLSGGSIGVTSKSNINLTAGAGDGVLARVTTNTTSAFQVQGAAGNTLLNVDSANSAIALGTSPAQLGSTNIGANGNSGGQNGIQFSRVITGGATSITSASVYFRSSDGSPNNKYQVALYSDNAGSPGAKITASGDSTLSAPGWNNVPLAANLSATTTYWIGITVNGSFNGADNDAFDTGGDVYEFWKPGDVVNGTTVGYGQWPSTFVGGPVADFANSNTLSAYLNTTSSSSYAIVTDNNGRVGIGESSPSTTAQLDVRSPSVYGYAAFFQGETTINSRNTQAFNVLDGVGNNIVSVDALNSRTYINSNTNSGLQGSLNVFSNGRHENILNLFGEGITEFSVTDGGQATFKNYTDTSTAFQIQNSIGTSLFSANTSGMTISVAGTDTSFATLALSNAHFSASQTTPPLLSTPNNCGTGATATMGAGATDSAGSFTITTGTGSTSSTCDIQLTFHSAYGSTPKSILVTPNGSAAAAARQIYVASQSNVGFSTSFGASAAGANSTSYTYDYWAVQ